MTKVASTSASPDLSDRASNGAVFSSAAPVVKEDPPAVEKVADVRLVIEEDPATGSFIYKTLDRTTGAIVNQFPREQVLRLKNAANYAPGKVFKGQS